VSNVETVTAAELMQWLEDAERVRVLPLGDARLRRGQAVEVICRDTDDLTDALAKLLKKAIKAGVDLKELEHDRQATEE
jgi:hypothetical protein